MRSKLIRNHMHQHLPIVGRAEGVYIWDVDGTEYIDASSGAVVAGLGHADPVVLRAMVQQAERVSFVHRGAFTSEAAELLADRLATITGLQAVWLVNSGSEAVEAALQFAVQYWRELGEPHRTEFLSQRHGYHGATMGALSLSGHARRENLDPLLHPFPELPAPWPHRYQGGRTEAEFTRDLLGEAEAVIRRRRDHLAGIFIEPVGGATGAAVLPPRGYLDGLQALCREAGILLITDEVMTGLWRTGPALAGNHWGLEPDIVTLGKGLGAGYVPIAAVMLSAKVVSGLADGSGLIRHGHTYAGNPLASATALAVLDRMDELRVQDNVGPMGNVLLDELRRIADSHPMVTEVRGIGLLAGVELRPTDAQPAGTDRYSGGRVAADVVAKAAEAGLLVYPATGGVNDAILVAPPLTVTGAQLSEIAARLDRALTAAEALGSDHIVHQDS